jgi:hypothetical protein
MRSPKMAAADAAQRVQRKGGTIRHFWGGEMNAACDLFCKCAGKTCAFRIKMGLPNNGPHLIRI